MADGLMSDTPIERRCALPVSEISQPDGVFMACPLLRDRVVDIFHFAGMRKPAFLLASRISLSDAGFSSEARMSRSFSRGEKSPWSHVFRLGDFSNDRLKTFELSVAEGVFSVGNLIYSLVFGKCFEVC